MQTIVTPKRRRRWWTKVLLALLVLVLIFVLLKLSANTYMVRRLNRVVRESRAGGLPLSFREIEAQRPADPPGKTAAQIFKALRPRLQPLVEDKSLAELPEWDKKRDVPIGCIWSERESAKMNAVLERVRPELAAMNEMKDYPSGSLPLVFGSNAIETGLPPLQDVRLATRLEALAAFHDAMEGQTRSAIEHLAVLSRLQEMLNTYPSLISSLHHVSSQTWMAGTIEHVCGVTQFTPEQLGDMANMLESMETDDPMWWGLLGDRAMFYESGSSLLQSAPTSILNPGGMLGSAWRVRRDLALGLRIYNRFLDAGHDLGKRAEHDERSLPGMPDEDHLGRDYPLVATFMPSFGRAVELNRRSRALLRAARIGLAAERYRLDHGVFPVHAQELVPEYLKDLPLDPFDDKPLRYTTTADGVMIHSIRVDVDRYEDGVQPPGVPPLLRFELKVPSVRARKECPPESAPANEG